MSPLVEDLMTTALQHHQAGRLTDAESIYRQILAVEPRHPDALHLLGMVAYQNGHLGVAVDLIREAIAIHKTAASYYSNLGNVLQAQGELEEASSNYRQALALKPGMAEVANNLGNVLRAQGKVDECLICYRYALVVKPDLAEASLAEAMALLVKGEFAAGWQSYARRWQTQDFDTPMRTYPQPIWNGERLTNGRLLIWPEQGIGDEIMFAGLIPDAISAGNLVVLDCNARLKPLFARSFPSTTVLSGYDPELHSDLQVTAQLPSGSLPGIYRGDSASFARTVSPYLVADPLDRERFRSRYSGGRRLIGLAWHTTNRKSGRERSIDLSVFAPLFELANIQWISLQYGDHDALEYQAQGVPIVIDRSIDQLVDLDHFAAQVAAMDMVITIDNSTAHLAGALGVPTWLLLPFAPDWRWLLDREDSAWYPGMRLFRQQMRGDWGPVIESVRNALSK
jgi:Tfp pilus assembly protein PilF